eukprot:55835-Amphidinium_carterae.1
MLALTIMMNLFWTPPFIVPTSVPLLLKFVLLLDGPWTMRSSLISRAMLVCLMVFGTFLAVSGEIYVTPSWSSSTRTPTTGLVLS